MTDKVSVVAEAPEGSFSKVIYPVAELKETKNKDAADAFMEFLPRGHKFSILENFLSIRDFTSQTLASFPSNLVGACLPQTLLAK